MTLLGPLGERQLGGASEANRHGHVLRSRPPATVLRTAVEERFDYRPAPNEYRPTPLRGADLVSRDREKIEPHRRTGSKPRPFVHLDTPRLALAPRREPHEPRVPTDACSTDCQSVDRRTVPSLRAPRVEPASSPRDRDR